MTLSDRDASKLLGTVSNDMKAPETAYAKTPDGLGIAYQIAGEGPIDLLVVGSMFSHLDLDWEDPALLDFYTRLASFGRLILFDPRGTGASDSLPEDLMSLEDWVDDISAVLDAARSASSAVFGFSDGGLAAMTFTASHPDRVSSLVLLNAFARVAWAEDYPFGLTQEQAEQLIALVEQAWGTGVLADIGAPSEASDVRTRRLHGRTERATGGPRRAGRIFRQTYQLDVRHILGAIRVPTLVLHRRDALLTPVDHARYLAAHIPAARLTELPWADLSPVAGDVEGLLDEVEEFLTGSRHGARIERALATVLFSDIVASTEHAVRLQDRRWRQLLTEHDRLVQREVERFRGRVVKKTGDGVLAVFDGPARAIRAAVSIRDGCRAIGIEVRTGLHTGELETIGEDVGGIAVHIAARVQALAEPNEILVSRTLTDLVAGSGIEFDQRGEHELKGVPGTWTLFSVTG
jgi:class 3 adenylate cyclase